MSSVAPNTTINPAATDYEDFSKSTLGFWIYLMTDCVLFATLFATYIVLHNNTNGGPSSSDLFSLPYVLTETVILLVSSFTSGIAMLMAHRGKTNLVTLWLGVTILLGAMFLTLELTEFTKLVHDGSSWASSAFLSSYFTLVGTHGLHITIGIVWIVALILQLRWRGLTAATVKRLTLLNLFWHFLDIVWIFIFTVVYLLGVI